MGNHISKIVIFTFWFTLLTIAANAQQNAVSGTVTDSSGISLPGVNIKVKGTTVGTATGGEGHYNLNVASLQQDTLVFSFIGYQTKAVPINGRTMINISLQSQVLAGQQMVVVGYGTQEKENITGSVSQIKGENISQQPVANVSSALMGGAAGVTVTQNTGRPGSNGGTIRIRGLGTLGNNDPLILIDGVEGDLDELDANNIQNISVLKDAAAAAIYGSRAANGVVLVTTKRANKNELQVAYKAYVGIQKPTNTANPVSADEYMKYNNIALENAGKAEIWSKEYIENWEQNHKNNPTKYPNTDWIGQTLSEQGFMQNHNLSISGGTKNVSVFSSLSFLDQNGNVPNNNYKNYRIRVNTDIDISKLKFSFDFNAQRSFTNRPQNTNAVAQAYRTPKIYGPAVNPDGTWGTNYTSGNYLAKLHDGGFNDLANNYLRANLYATYKPIDNVEINLRYAPEYANHLRKAMNKAFMTKDYVNDQVFTLNKPVTLEENYGESFTHNVNFVIKYNKSISQKHSIKAMAGYEFIKHNNKNIQASREGYLLQNLEQLDAGSQSNLKNGGNASSYALQSFFSRLNYNYDNRYLVEANLRYDGSSRFAQKNRYGLFPSFSVGWRISNEEFMKAINIISNLKLRGSWGQLGNQKIGTYPYLTTVNLGQNYPFGGQSTPGAAQLALANTKISWESTTTTDFGIDLGMVDNKINLTADYYIKNTDDILLRLPIPAIIGRNAPYQNAGKVRNTGWEFSFNYRNHIGQNFQYNIGLNISNNKNTVTDLKNAGPFIKPNTVTKEGYPINSIYGYEAKGYFNSQQEIDNSATQSGNIAPGDIKYKDQLTIDTNGDGVPDKADGVINAKDRTIIGDPFPRFPFSVNLSAKYKAFDVKALFQGYGKREVLLGGNIVTAFQNLGNMFEWQKNYWTPDNRHPSYPRLIASSQHSNFDNSDQWVYNAAYIRLRNLQVGYTLPENLIQHFPINHLRIYFSGENLFTLDDMVPGVDPNINNGEKGSGTSTAFYPITANYTLGINIKF